MILSSLERDKDRERELKTSNNMNLKEIKLRFSTFLNQFNKDDIKLLMQFLEMIVDEYNSNPYKLFGWLSLVLLI